MSMLALPTLTPLTSKLLCGPHVASIRDEMNSRLDPTHLVEQFLDSREYDRRFVFQLAMCASVACLSINVCNDLPSCCAL